MMGQRKTEDVLHHSEEELYDIVADPMETRNLADSSTHAATLKELRDKVTNFRRETGDPWLGYFERIHQPPEPLTSG